MFVAAQEDVLSDREAIEDEISRLFAHADERKIGRPTADVADQDDVAPLDLPAPGVAAVADPGVKGGLGLFEQSDLLQTALARGLDRELARGCVERGGDGQDHLGVLEAAGAGFPEAEVPGVAQVRQVGRRRIDG